MLVRLKAIASKHYPLVIVKKIVFKTVTNHWGWSLKGIKTWIKFGWALFESWGIERPPSRCYKVLFFVLKVSE